MRITARPIHLREPQTRIGFLSTTPCRPPVPVTARTRVRSPNGNSPWRMGGPARGGIASLWSKAWGGKERQLPPYTCIAHAKHGESLRVMIGLNSEGNYQRVGVLSRILNGNLWPQERKRGLSCYCLRLLVIRIHGGPLGSGVGLQREEQNRRKILGELRE
jgi:hypothetical protein